MKIPLAPPADPMKSPAAGLGDRFVHVVIHPLCNLQPKHVIAPGGLFQLFERYRRQRYDSQVQLSVGSLDMVALL